MKTAFLPSFEVCNIHGRELVVDLLLLEAESGDTQWSMFIPGTMTDISEVHLGINECEFDENEMNGWLDHIGGQMMNFPCTCHGPTTNPSGECVGCGRPTAWKEPV